jgi:hypothetical protein
MKTAVAYPRKMFGQSTRAAEERFANIKTEKGWNSWGGSISDGGGWSVKQ